MVVSRWPPFPLEMGAPIRTNRLLSGLSREFETTFLTFQHRPNTPELHLPAADLRQALDGVDVVTVPYPRVLPKRLAQARSLFERHSWEWGRYRQPSFSGAVAALAHEREVDVIHFDDAGTLLSGPVPGRRNVYCAHDIAHRVSRATAEIARGPRRGFAQVEWRKVAREELRGWRAMDLCVAASPIDASIMAKAGARRTAVALNGTDSVERLPVPAREPGEPVRILFVGNGAYQPYARGLAWFVTEVVPRVRETLPAAFRAVGRRPHNPVTAAGVEYTGTVPDLREHYEWAHVAVVPVFEGSGTRLKIPESMAYRRPVVSTSMGAEGLPIEGGRHYRRADDAEGFAAAIVDAALAAESPATLGRELEAAHEAIQPLFWPSIAAGLAKSYLELIDEMGPA